MDVKYCSIKPRNSQESVACAGLKELAELKSLKTLLLADTKVTEAGLKEHRRALPGCRTSVFLAGVGLGKRADYQQGQELVLNQWKWTMKTHIKFEKPKE